MIETHRNIIVTLCIVNLESVQKRNELLWGSPHNIRDLQD